MDFIAVLHHLQAFDVTRLVVFFQGITLLVLLGKWIYHRWNLEEGWYSIAGQISWWILVAVGVYDTFVKLGDPVIEWWRSPIRSIAYAIGIAGVLYRLKREGKKLPRQDSNL